MEELKKSIVSEIERLKNTTATKEEVDLLDDLVKQFINSKKSKKEKESKEYRKTLVSKLSELSGLSKDNMGEVKSIAQSIIEAVKEIKLNVEAPVVNVEQPKVEVSVPEIKIPEIKVPETKIPTINIPKTVFPSRMSVNKPTWLPKMPDLSGISSSLKAIEKAIKGFKLTRKPSKDYITVRLSNGQKFYEARGGGGMFGGGSSQVFRNSDGDKALPLVNDDGELYVVNSGLAIAKGDVASTSFISKFGQNSDIGTVTYEDIWDGGGTYTYPADNTAPITHLYSTGADTVDIEVQGLDINGNQVVQTKTLAGTTVVALDTALWRVFRMKNVNSTDILGGSIVHASDSGKAVSYAQIQNGNNQTLMALYTIPAGKTGYLVAGSASIVGTVRDYSIDGRFYMRPFGGVFQLKHTFGASTNGTSTFQHMYAIPLPIEEKTDIRVSAISSKTGGVMNSTFDIVLVDN